MDEAPPLLPIADELPPGHRSGFVAVIGRPNVGKSTLVNTLLGQKIAIVSPKPQTTRNRLLGILTRPDAQVIFVDTPGIHKPMHKLGEFMREQALAAIPDADVLVWLVDAAVSPTAEDREIAALLAASASAIPLLMALNKVDLLAADELPERQQVYRELLVGAARRPEDSPLLPISALQGDRCADLLELVIAHLPPGPRYFPPDQVTDQQERFLAAELVREQALLHLHQEVPHGIAVVVDEFKERETGLAYISATLYVERESHKAIVLGRKGSMLKAIGQAARLEIERALDRPVYLDLWVKVRPRWRRDPADLQRLGYGSRR